jgi:hypothetical protein
MHDVAVGVEQLPVGPLDPRISVSERQAITAVQSPLEQTAPFLLFKLAIDLPGGPFPLCPLF